MILFLVFFGVVLCFGLVLLVGAPYLPTQRRQVDAAIKLLDLKPGAVVYELGSGDGRVARRLATHGYRVIGYELNPLLYIVSLIITRPVRDRVQIRLANFWQADLRPADAIFVFLLDTFMVRLDRKLTAELRSGTPLISYAFRIPGKKPKAEREGIFLYQY